MNIVKRITAFAVLGLACLATGNAFANNADNANVNNQLNSVKSSVQNFTDSNMGGVDFQNPQFSEGAKSVFKSIGKSFGSASKAFGAGFSDVLDSTKSGLKNVGVDVDAVGESIADGASSAKSGLKDAGIDVDKMGKAAASGVKSTASVASSAFKDVGATVASGAASAKSGLKDAGIDVDKMGKAAASGVEQVNQGLKNAGVDVSAVGGTVLSGVAGGIDLTSDTVKNVDINAVGEKISSGVSATVDTTKQVFQGVGSGLGEVGSDIGEATSTVAKNVSGFFKNLSDKISSPSSMDSPDNLMADLSVDKPAPVEKDIQGFESLIADLSVDKPAPVEKDVQGFENLMADLSSDRIDPVFDLHDDISEVNVVTTSDTVNTSNLDTLLDGPANNNSDLDRLLDGVDSNTSNLDSLLDGTDNDNSDLDRLLDGVDRNTSNLDSLLDGTDNDNSDLDRLLDGVDSNTSNLDSLLDGTDNANSDLDRLLDGADSDLESLNDEETTYTTNIVSDYDDVTVVSQFDEVNTEMSDAPVVDDEIRTIGGYDDEIRTIGGDSSVPDLAEVEISSVANAPVQQEFDFDFENTNDLDVYEIPPLAEKVQSKVKVESKPSKKMVSAEAVKQIQSEASSIDSNEPLTRRVAGSNFPEKEKPFRLDMDTAEGLATQVYIEKDAQELSVLKDKYPDLQNYYTQGNMDRVVYNLKNHNHNNSMKDVLENRVKFQQVLEFAAKVGPEGEDMLKVSVERAEQYASGPYQPHDYRKLVQDTRDKVISLGYAPSGLEPLDDDPKYNTQELYDKVNDIIEHTEDASPSFSVHDIAIEEGRVCATKMTEAPLMKKVSAISLGVAGLIASGGSSTILSLGDLIDNKSKCDSLNSWDEIKEVAKSIVSEPEKPVYDQGDYNGTKEILALNKDLFNSIKKNIEVAENKKKDSLEGEYVSDNEFVVKNIRVVNTSSLVINKSVIAENATTNSLTVNKGLLKEVHQELTEQNKVLENKKMVL